MIGQKGIPATHGGVERHVEELGAGLVALGHEVTVFTRPNYTDPSVQEYRGMRVKSLPTVGTKHLDAIVHSVLASFSCWGGDFDVVHYHAIGPCLASPIVKVRGLPVVATIHGQDWRRGKWGPLASGVLRGAEWMALHVADAAVSVSETLAVRYRAESGRDVVYIPNGVSIDFGDDGSVLRDFGLHDRAYVLFAGRLVPEKGVHYLVEAHRRAGLTMPLVIAGDASYSEDYVAALHAGAAEDVVFTGYQYGARLAALFRHTALFVLPSDLEGLPIVLLEARAYGAPVLASDIAANVEVMGAEGRFFAAGDAEALERALLEAVADGECLAREAEMGRERAAHDYDWANVAEQTAAVYQRVLRGRDDPMSRPSGQ